MTALVWAATLALVAPLALLGHLAAREEAKRFGVGWGALCGNLVATLAAGILFHIGWLAGMAALVQLATYRRTRNRARTYSLPKGQG